MFLLLRDAALLRNGPLHEREELAHGQLPDDLAVLDVLYTYVIVAYTKGLIWDLVPRTQIRPFVNSLFSNIL